DGAVVDALPGIYTPDDFFAEAGPALDVVRAKRALTPQVRQELHGAAARTDLLSSEGDMAMSFMTISKGVVENPPRLAMPLVFPPQGATIDLSKFAMSSREVVQLTVPQAANATPTDIGLQVVAFDSAQNRRLVRP